MATSRSSSSPRRPTTFRMLMLTSSLFGASPFMTTTTTTFLFFDSVPVKKKLRATNKLSMVFDADLPETRFTSLSSDPCQASSKNVIVRTR
ncbi:hypothetical protein F5H01DRAFT_373726 [Linnemannia elongata]|nr:hypothetical protein F5H01DRAFT_373726 [Linnemannia elongata]